MSSFSGTLELDSKNFQVISFQYSLHRNTDHQGRAASGLRDSIIELELVTPAGDITFYKWLSNNEMKDGKIKFNQIDQASLFNQVEFKQTLCFSYVQAFQANSANPMTIKVRLSTGFLGITSGATEFENHFFQT
jgi:hypothetical protein